MILCILFLFTCPIRPHRGTIQAFQPFGHSDNTVEGEVKLFHLIRRVADRNNPLLSRPCRITVRSSFCRSLPYQFGMLQDFIVIINPMEYIGIYDPFLSLVHHIITIIKFPKSSAAGSHHHQVRTEFIIIHLSGKIGGIAINRVVVIKMRQRELERTCLHKIEIAVVPVRQELVELRRAFYVQPSDVLRVLHPHGVSPLQEPRAGVDIACQVNP